jgi:hypothetical protein
MKTQSLIPRKEFAYFLTFRIVVDILNKYHTGADIIEETYKHTKQYIDLVTPTKLH